MKPHVKCLTAILSVLLLTGCSQSTTSTVPTDGTAGSKTVNSVGTTDEGCIITVNAKSELNLSPDIAYINIGYVCSGSDTEKITNDNNTVMARIISALKAKGIADDDIKTSSFNIYPVYNYENGQTKVKEYSVSHILKVTINDISKIGNVLDAAIGEGANQSFSISYNIKDYDTQYNNAMMAAVDQGNIKADAIAKSLGVSTYKLNKITENTNSSSYIYPTAEYKSDTSSSSIGSTQIQTGTITITAQLTMEYIITK